MELIEFVFQCWCTELVIDQFHNVTLYLQRPSSRINYDALKSLGGDLVSISWHDFALQLYVMLGTWHPEFVVLQQYITFGMYHICRRKGVNRVSRAGQILMLRIQQRRDPMRVGTRRIRMIMRLLEVMKMMRCNTNTKMKIFTMSLILENEIWSIDH